MPKQDWPRTMFSSLHSGPRTATRMMPQSSILEAYNRASKGEGGWNEILARVRAPARSRGEQFPAGAARSISAAAIRPRREPCHQVRQHHAGDLDQARQALPAGSHSRFRTEEGGLSEATERHAARPHGGLVPVRGRRLPLPLFKRRDLADRENGELRLLLPLLSRHLPGGMEHRERRPRLARGTAIPAGDYGAGTSRGADRPESGCEAPLCVCVEFGLARGPGRVRDGAKDLDRVLPGPGHCVLQTTQTAVEVAGRAET